MRPSNRSTVLRSVLAIALFASTWSGLTANACAGESQEARSNPAPEQRLFVSPEDAANAWQAAVESRDKGAMYEVFGPEFHDLLTGDEVQDANNAQRLAAALKQGFKPVAQGADTITFVVGTNRWPMPIPLVRGVDGKWKFDTASGKEEIINRHIGKDELHAIGVCRAYVAAQRQYAILNPDTGAGVRYAQKFKSMPGMKDGLYWSTSEYEPASPFGPLVAEAHAEGYVTEPDTGRQPFHGYYFRILTRQGTAAPGGNMDYMRHGNLAGGFALVAYPERWDHSGIMTFIVNQDGKVYQRNLGERTCRIAGSMEAYNPDDGWTLVQDQGVVSAVSEK